MCTAQCAGVCPSVSVSSMRFRPPSDVKTNGGLGPGVSVSLGN